MTDDEKLKLLDVLEEAAWEYLKEYPPVVLVESYALLNIERCQRIRANLETKPQYDGFTREQHVKGLLENPMAECILPHCPDHYETVYSDQNPESEHIRRL